LESNKEFAGLPLSNECELSLVLTSDKEIQKLNYRYRGKNKATDVLSFSMIEGEVGLVHSTCLGDIVISLDTAKKQAQEYNVNLYQELLRLLIHGILHLTGYDHENVSIKEAAKMRKFEENLYNKYLLRAKKIGTEPNY